MKRLTGQMAWTRRVRGNLPDGPAVSGEGHVVDAYRSGTWTRLSGVLGPVGRAASAALGS